LLVSDLGVVPGAVLPRPFFDRPALEVAEGLLGCVLEHATARGLVAVVLTEVEAYEGAADPASHAYRGRTGRNAVMFGPPGHAYVYFTYGMHFCVNLVCLPEGTASAVLLRAGRVIEGAGLAALRRSSNGGADLAGGRGLDSAREAAGGRGPDPGREPAVDGSPAPRRGSAKERDLARGPARLCQALGITRGLDGADVCDPASPLRVRSPEWDSPGETALSASYISRGPRVGISVAADRPWRFWLTGDPTVSVYRAHVPRRARQKVVSAPD
jgi:DNA-3-methyladenine glycosylase